MRIFFIFIVFMATLLGHGNYEPFYKLKPHLLEDTSCKKGKKAKLCFHKELKYPNSNILPSSIKNVVDIYIDKALKIYKGKTLADYLSDVDLDNDSYIFGTYEAIDHISLFDYNAPIVTIVDEYYNFQGGAHGIGGRNFVNYDIDTKKELSLNELVDFNNSKFLKIAEIAYRQSDKLLPDENLMDAGWLENSFVLAGNFAVTTKGLLFHYNPYEIKSYASGMSEFIIPYYKIVPFLRHKALQELATKSKKAKKITKEVQIKNGNINFTIEQISTREFSIDIETFIYTDKKVWFSLSFPQFKTSKNITNLHADSAKSFKLYKIGSKIYSKESKGVIKSRYPLLEAVSKKGEINISFNVKMPNSVPYFCINYRVTTLHNNLLKDDENIEYFDQQGFRVKRICLEK